MPIVQLIDLFSKDITQFFLVIFLLIVPLLISISFHEWAHGFVAYKFGDPTPKLYGRLTLNPFAHLDLVGTLMLFVVGIGWAKPVPVNILNIPNKTKQMLVALAGPMSNIMLAVVFSVILVLSNKFFVFDRSFSQIVFVIVSTVIRINLILAIFNMIPIPPFDGSKILAWVLPEKLAEKYLSLEIYGIAVLFLLLVSGAFKFILVGADLCQVKLLYLISLMFSS